MIVISRHTFLSGRVLVLTVEIDWTLVMIVISRHAFLSGRVLVLKVERDWTSDILDSSHDSDKPTHVSQWACPGSNSRERLDQ